MAKLILLADDSPDDLASVQLALKAADIGNPVLMLEDGSKVLAYLKGEGEYANRELHPLPKILLLDLNMPGIDGFDVLEWLNAESTLRNILVIVISGHSGLREVNQAYALGANSFLLKPADPLEIRNLVKAFPEYWMLGGEPPDQRAPL